MDRILNQFRHIIAFHINVGFVIAAYCISFFIRMDMDISRIPVELIMKTLPLIVVIRMTMVYVFQLERGLWKYVSIFDLIQIIKAATVGSAIFAAATIFILGVSAEDLSASMISYNGTDGFPRSIFLIDWATYMLVMSSTRISIRLFREQFWPITRSFNQTGKRVLIAGVDNLGAELSKQFLAKPTSGLNPIAFVDVETRDIGHSIQGIPIVGSISDVAEVISGRKIDLLVIADETLSLDQKKLLIESCAKAKIPCKTFRPIKNLLDSNDKNIDLRDVEPSDLLRRARTEFDTDEVWKFISNKPVMITGAAGSIGSELAKLVCSQNPKSVTLLDHSENGLFFLEAELRSAFPTCNISARVGDITNKRSIENLLLETHPLILLHAAAHKHVPLMEQTPYEAVNNNVAGTYNLAKLADSNLVETFVLVSSDKAVNPSSVMGVTKRISELIIQEIGKSSSTNFISVRFGNVLGSNASVVPIFQQQIANGGPVTVTDPLVERYFMSVSEAAGLILQAGAVGKSGQIFILEMGSPIKIIDLAETLISMSGFVPYKDIEIVFTGLRPGEKFKEELYVEGDSLRQSGYDKLLVLSGKDQDFGVLASVEILIDGLENMTDDHIRKNLSNLVPEYIS